jgi:hypothetical protein
MAQHPEQLMRSKKRPFNGVEYPERSTSTANVYTMSPNTQPFATPLSRQTL